MDEIKLRETTPDDIPSMLAIERLSFSTPWSGSAFLSEIGKPYSFQKVALAEDKIVGYICVNHILDEAHIMNLAVHPGFRRRGIAAILLKKAVNELKEKGVCYFYLEVRFSNLAARKFYEKSGFRIVGRRKNYYQSPEEDAALMTLGMY
jgi:[ribosomal protein S18]-alanine N-acetyltransferase